MQPRRFPDAGAQLRACFVSYGPVSISQQSGQGGGWALTARATATAFAENSLGELDSYEKTLELSVPIPAEVPAGMQLQPECWLSTDSVQCTCTGGTLTVTITARAEGAILGRSTRQGIGSISLGEALTPADPEITLRIYYAQEGEALFDIARRFHLLFPEWCLCFLYARTSDPAKRNLMSAIKIFERFYHKKCYKALFSGPAVEYNRQCLEQERSNFNMETSNSLLDADIIREQKPVWAFSRKVFCEGIRDGVPIALGYFAVSFSLGIAARKAGFTPFQGFLASLLNNASAGEYAAFALIMSGASYFQVAVITLIANARYLLMSCALAQRFAPGTPFWHRLVIGYDVTDELFGITIARPGSLNPCYTYGAILLAAPAWASGTALGIVAGNLLPLRAVSALSVALYGMFLAIIIPPARKDKVVAVLVAISFALSFACNYLPGISALSDGTRTILLTVLISSAAAVLFPVKDQEAEHDA